MSQTNSEIQDMPIPPDVQKRMNETQKMIENYETAKKLREQFPALKRRLEAYRESRPQQNNFREVGAIDHWEMILRQHETKLTSSDVAIQQLDKRLEEQLKRLNNEIDRCKEAHQIQVKQYMKAKEGVCEKKAYAEEKLQKAKDRLNSTTAAKSKDEILVEKTIMELFQKYIEVDPTGDFNYCFPGYKDLNLQLPLRTQIVPPPAPAPAPAPPSIPKVKRQQKIVEEREPILEEEAPLETKTDPPPQKETPPVQKVFRPAPPTESPFPKVITNTKRPPKQVD